MFARKSLVAGFFALALVMLTASFASAAPVDYSVAFAPGALPQPPHLTVDGDQLTAFWVELRPTACDSGPTQSTFEFSLPSPVSISNGQFSFQASTGPQYGDPAYVADISAQGSVSPDRRVVVGTLTIANGKIPGSKNCTGSFNFIALPSASTPETFKTDAKSDFTNKYASLDYKAGVLKHFKLLANFKCGGGMDDARFYGDLAGFPAIHASSSGAFAIHTYVLEEFGYAVVLDVRGRVGSRSASGTYSVAEPPGGFTNIAGAPCAGSGKWVAKPPVAPEKPGPQVYFNWNAARITVGGADSYYFYVTNLRCKNGATEASIGVGKRRFTFGCSRHSGFASGPLAPGAAYVGHAQALRIRAGRITKRGAKLAEPLTMPTAGASWTPVGGLGTPPK